MVFPMRLPEADTSMVGVAIFYDAAHKCVERARTSKHDAVALRGVARTSGDGVCSCRTPCLAAVRLSDTEISNCRTRSFRGPRGEGKLLAAVPGRAGRSGARRGGARRGLRR